MAIIEIVKEDTFGIWRTKDNQLSLVVGDFDLLVPLTRYINGSTSSSGTTVTGSSTTFLTDLQPGDRIRSRFNSQDVIIQQINSDTELITNDAFTPPLVDDMLMVYANDIVEAIQYLDLKFKFNQRRLLICALALN